MTYDDGSSWEGMWKNNLRYKGEGVLVVPGGKKYYTKYNAGKAVKSDKLPDIAKSAAGDNVREGTQ